MSAGYHRGLRSIPAIACTPKAGRLSRLERSQTQLANVFHSCSTSLERLREWARRSRARLHRRFDPGLAVVPPPAKIDLHTQETNRTATKKKPAAQEYSVRIA